MDEQTDNLNTVASIYTFIQTLTWSDVDISTQSMTRRCLLDLLGVAASGTQTDLSRIIRAHAVDHFGSPAESCSRLIFDGRLCSPTGAALATGMTIDAIDAHDGYKPSKGHAGCGVLAGTLALLDSEHGDAVSFNELLTCLLIGYEVACRAAVALHNSVSDYHTSGAWVALAVAAVGSRVLKLDLMQTREALGIAEYHGPRSQMMRCIDHPTMVKDGSGWGAMAGVSACCLAKAGFTGAPALTVESSDLERYWSDLGDKWLIEEQYFKPYPVCRWAQPAVVAALELQHQHRFTAADIAQLTIHTFHESARLATTSPATTEQAQYSLPFPVAAALHHQTIGVAQISGDGLQDQSVLALSRSIQIVENDSYNREFPERRISRVIIRLHDGLELDSGSVEATGDPEHPLSQSDIQSKFEQFAGPVLGEKRVQELLGILDTGYAPENLQRFNQLLYSPGFARP